MSTLPKLTIGHGQPLPYLTSQLCTLVLSWNVGVTLTFWAPHQVDWTTRLTMHDFTTNETMFDYCHIDF